jgi:hypothetical protein
MTVLIALPAPWLPESGARGGMMPELPAFSHLLRAGRRLPAARDQRDGLLLQLAMRPVHVAPCAVAASALESLPAAVSSCLAAPVHMVAGISRVHLPPGGRLALDDVEEQAWCASFNQEFGSHDLRLHVVAPGGGWLLQAPFARGAREAEPGMLVGEALAREPAADGDERMLRRLGTEVEMWLAAHEMNREREARRVPVLSAIWFWGGGVTEALPPVPHVAGVYSNDRGDAWLAGLARHAGVAVSHATCWDEVAAMLPARAATGTDRCIIMLVPLQGGMDEGFWSMVEEAWMAPLERAIGGGAVTRLLLQVGPRAWRVPDRSLLRWLRSRRRNWWQIAGQVRP